MTNYIERFMKDNDLKVNERFLVSNCTFYFDDTFSLVYVDGHEANDGTLRALLSGEIKIKKLKKEPWKPEYGEKFWHVDDYGFVVRVDYQCFKDEDYLVNHHLIFKTEVGAKDYKWFLEKVDEYKKPFVSCEANNYLKYDIENKMVNIDVDYTEIRQGVVYFRGGDNIIHFIDEVGEDRIKKYMFNIWE